MIGTKKGAFILDGDRRGGWEVSGPFCQAWPAHHVTYDPATETLYAGGNVWFRPAVWRSLDWGATWAQSREGITYSDAGPKISKVWNVIPAHGAIYAGPVIREHINVFVDGERSTLDTPLRPGAEVRVITAVSGG